PIKLQARGFFRSRQLSLSHAIDGAVLLAARGRCVHRPPRLMRACRARGVFPQATVVALFVVELDWCDFSSLRYSAYLSCWVWSRPTRSARQDRPTPQARPRWTPRWSCRKTERNRRELLRS